MVGGDEYAAALRDLPTIVETYKTYDDVNMVKCTDIGQVGNLCPTIDTPPEGVPACCQSCLGDQRVAFKRPL